jgi:hypothetical protein
VIGGTFGLLCRGALGADKSHKIVGSGCLRCGAGFGNFASPTIRRIDESPTTCHYWRRAYLHDGTVVGCGGYGEVSPNHPAAGEQICHTDEARICKRCHGTGREPSVKKAN